MHYDTYHEQLSAYTHWWRSTPPEVRSTTLHPQIINARQQSHWFQLHDLDPQKPIPTQAPLITRTMLQQHSGAFIGDLRAITHGGYLGRTSGTTGDPVDVWMCAWSLAHYYLHLEYALSLSHFPLPSKPNILYLSIATKAHTFSEPAPLWDATILRHDSTSVEEAIKTIKSFKTNILSLTPFELKSLLQHPTKLPHVEIIISTSGYLHPDLVDALHHHLPDTLLINSYGLSEIGPVAIQCPHSPQEIWHIPPGSAIVERMTDNALVVTTLRNRAMPLTRYVTGDAVAHVINAHTCPHCDHHGQSFQNLTGRALHTFYTSNNQQRSAVLWLRVLNDPTHHVLNHHISQPRPGHLSIHCLVPHTQGTPQLDQLHASLRAQDPRMHITLTYETLKHM